jgi:hydroxypyruvate isomerase
VIRFAANLGLLWPDRPLLARIDAAAAAGFRAIELHFPYDIPAAQVAEAARRHDLTLLGINTPPGREKGEAGSAAVPGRQAEFQQGLDQAIAYCAESAASAIHVMAGNIEPAERRNARATFAINLRAAATKAAASGLTLLLEPLNRHDRPLYFYSKTVEAVSLIEELGVPNLKVQFDAYHVGRGGGDVLAELSQYWPYIGHVQIAAVPTRAEPDEGELDYREVFHALESLGYSGWVGCEYSPRAGTDAGLAWLSRLMG